MEHPCGIWAYQLLQTSKEIFNNWEAPVPQGCSVTPYFLCISFPGAGDVWFSLNGTTYQNNSIVILEDIGEGDDALRCLTSQTACCRPPYVNGSALGNWFFPNGSSVPSSGMNWDIYSSRGRMVVVMHRRRSGVEGIYHCVIPDTSGFIQTIYIGVYSASNGEW